MATNVYNINSPPQGVMTASDVIITASGSVIRDITTMSATFLRDFVFQKDDTNGDKLIVQKQGWYSLSSEMDLDVNPASTSYAYRLNCFCHVNGNRRVTSGQYAYGSNVYWNLNIAATDFVYLNVNDEITCRIHITLPSVSAPLTIEHIQIRAKFESE